MFHARFLGYFFLARRDTFDAWEWYNLFLYIPWLFII